MCIDSSLTFQGSSSLVQAPTHNHLGESINIIDK